MSGGACRKFGRAGHGNRDARMLTVVAIGTDPSDADTDGDGVADTSSVFAGGFNDPLDGIGAGVLWLNNSLYYTCIPNLWKQIGRAHV